MAHFHKFGEPLTSFALGAEAGKTGHMQARNASEQI